MREQLKEKLNTQLSNIASDILISAGSFFCWGEVEVPECLRAELETDETNQSEQ